MEHIKKFDEFHNIEKNVVDVNEGCLALNHDETPSHIHTEPLCEIARINVCESGNGLFPYNKWELKVYSNDHTPPHFHVIADGWDVSFKIDNGELLVVNRKGRNDTIYQYMMDNIPKWLEAPAAILPKITNRENANAVWKQIHAMTDDFSSKHRVDEMATISCPSDNFPRQSKVIVNSETLNENTSIEESYDMLCEMANLSQRRTGINTRIYVSSKEGQHGPRIKVYNSSNDESFSMSIEDSPKVLIGNPNIVSTKIFKQIIKWVQINKNILLYYWQHSDMDIDDLLDGIKKI